MDYKSDVAYNILFNTYYFKGYSSEIIMINTTNDTYAKYEWIPDSFGYGDGISAAMFVSTYPYSFHIDLK